MDSNTYNQHIQSLFAASQGNQTGTPVPLLPYLDWQSLISAVGGSSAAAFQASAFSAQIAPPVQWTPSSLFAPGATLFQNNNAQLAQLVSRELEAVEAMQENSIKQDEMQLEMRKKNLEAVKIARQYFEAYATGTDWNIGRQVFAHQAPGIPTMDQAPNVPIWNQEPSESVGRVNVPEEEEIDFTNAPEEKEPEIDFSPPAKNQTPTEKTTDDRQTALGDVKEEQENVPEMQANKDCQEQDIPLLEPKIEIHESSQHVVSEVRRIEKVAEKLQAPENHQSEEEEVKQEINEIEEKHVESRDFDYQPLKSSASSKMIMDEEPTEEQKPERQSTEHQFEDVELDNWNRTNENLLSIFEIVEEKDHSPEEDGTIEPMMEEDMEQKESSAKRGKGRPKKDISGKRGRPSKCSYFGPKNEDEVTDEEDKMEKAPTTSENEPLTKKGRGRPKKEKKKSTTSENEQPKKRGRPPKSAYFGPHFEEKPSKSEEEPPMKKRKSAEN